MDLTFEQQNTLRAKIKTLSQIKHTANKKTIQFQVRATGLKYTTKGERVNGQWTWIVIFNGVEAGYPSFLGVVHDAVNELY